MFQNEIQSSPLPGGRLVYALKCKPCGVVVFREETDRRDALKALDWYERVRPAWDNHRAPASESKWPDAELLAY